MTKSVQARPAVLDWQARAQRARLEPRLRRLRPSRAARLHLIDILSRWGGSGLALVAGVAAFAAIAAGRSYPLRAALWASLVLGALVVARNLLRRFRAGGRSCSHPFRWRADYTASLAVVSSAFGAGALILIPRGADPALAYQTLSLLIGASLGAGVIHAAHGRAALAAWLPAFAFIFVGAAKTSGLAAALLGVGAALATGAAALFFFHSYLRQKITRRFPRTSLVRRGIGGEADGETGSGAARPARIGGR